MSQKKLLPPKNKVADRLAEGNRTNPFDLINTQRAAAAAENLKIKQKSGSSTVATDPSWNELLRIVRWEATGVRALQTIQAPGGSSKAHFLDAFSLADISKRLRDEVDFKFSICFGDGSTVPQSMKVARYFQATPLKLVDRKEDEVEQETRPPAEIPTEGKVFPGTKESQEKDDIGKVTKVTKATKEDNGAPSTGSIPETFVIFVKECKGPFSRLPFRLRFVKKGTSDEIRGSVESTVFDTSRLPYLTMAHLRRMVTDMSARLDVHEFCFADETQVHEGTLLSSYLANVKDTDDSVVPIFTVYFRNSGGKSSWAAAPDTVKAPPVDRTLNLAPDDWKDDKVTSSGIEAKVKDPLSRGLDAQTLNDLKAKSSSAKFLHASELDEQQWQTVLRNCNLMHGWILDLDRMEVRPAPNAAFQLRRGLNMPSEKDQQLPPLGDVAANAKQPPEAASKTAGEQVLPAQDDLEDSADIQAAETATEATEQTRTTDPIAADSDNTPASPPSQTKPISRFQASTRKISRDLESALPQKISAFPSFVMNDSSKVTVSLVTHELQESMAKNSFTSTSFEGEVSGSFKAIGIGLSGGATTTSKTGISEAKSTVEKKLIADYKFARATVYLSPGDLEPTAALKAAIERVKRSKNINDLRVLHERFGHFFCHEAVVGGSLQTSRLTSGKSKASESRQKEDFKAQVGLAASSPKGLAGSMKASRQKSSDGAEGNEEHELSDTQAFEATGGDSILASNPPEWCASVRHFQNWRTIERSRMSMLGTAISQCADASLTHVKEWFLEAVPYRSEYLSVPPSRVLDVRLKVAADIPGLTDVYDEATFRKRSICNYLGHQYGKAVHPIRMGMTRRKSVTDQKVTKSEKSFGVTVNDLTKTYKQFDVQSQVGLFSPAQFQAPVLLQYEDLDRRIEMLNLQEYQETIWQVVVPIGEHLKNGSLVALRSYNKNVNLYLTIFRNTQGHYLPAISDSGDTPFWRINKVEDVHSTGSGIYIREGDSIRLCWRFSDQTCGFRDYQDDIYGRRRFTKPADAPAELYLKTPFPGFERADSRVAPKLTERASPIDTKTALAVPQLIVSAADKNPVEMPNTKTASKSTGHDKNGAAMIMSGDGGSKPLLSLVEVVPHKDVWDNKITYNLFDVTFRIDVLGNNVLGELSDYMTAGLDQTTCKVIEKETKSKTTSWSEIDRQKSKDTYVEYGKQIAGHALFGWGFTWLREEFRPLSRALNL
ncbi:hypothetical protein E8E13_002474 [Curvularia kusanoi]|uniref:MACPF-like domain-containing protein n=1 Tax=Curvularia kusanoi TaxID=90978 RepID=A0A9P4T3T9_CURKU|nr:hypothetical protein E8E13_002474 [Curvularia kusanoi]